MTPKRTKMRCPTPATPKHNAAKTTKEQIQRPGEPHRPYQKETLNSHAYSYSAATGSQHPP